MPNMQYINMYIHTLFHSFLNWDSFLLCCFTQFSCSLSVLLTVHPFTLSFYLVYPSIMMIATCLLSKSAQIRYSSFTTNFPEEISKSWLNVCIPLNVYYECSFFTIHAQHFVKKKLVWPVPGLALCISNLSQFNAQFDCFCKRCSHILERKNNVFMCIVMDSLFKIPGNFIM